MEASSCPVEILSPQQAAGRRFTHLWLMGMRDSEWPPPVRLNAMLDHQVVNAHAPELLEQSYARATEEIGAALGLCDDRVKIRVSYAIRDSGGERVFRPVGEEQLSHDGADNHEMAGGSPESERPVEKLAGQVIKWRRWTRRFATFHPFYSERHTRRAWLASTENYNENVALDEVEAQALAESMWERAEYEAQFECPFRAFAVHRLGVEPRRKRFGSARVVEKREELEMLRQQLERQIAWDGENAVRPERSMVPMDGFEWPEWAVKNLSKFGRAPSERELIYSFEHVRNEAGRKGKEVREKTLIVDFAVGIDGRYQVHNLGDQNDRKDQRELRVHAVKKGSFDALCQRKKIYPLRVFERVTEEARNGALGTLDEFYAGYVAGGRLNQVYHFEEPWAALKDRAKGLLDVEKTEYKRGVLRPDPVEAKDRSRTWLPPVCTECHLQAACRYGLRE